MSGEAALPAEEWRRTSPLGFIVGAIMALRNAILPMAAIAFSTGGMGLVFVVPSLAAVLGFTTLFSYIAWRHFRYRLTESDIRVERGLFSRTARSVPYERIQDVSLEQSLIPRLFDMVEVKFETGAGGKDEVRIRYVTTTEAEGLRETVRARKSGEAVTTGAVAPAAIAEPSRTLFTMDTKRLLTFGLFEFSLVVFVVLAGAVQQFDFLLPFDPFNPEEWIRLLTGPGHWLLELGVAAQAVGIALALIALALLGLSTGLVRTVLRDYGFRLEETPKGLRRRRGLLTRTDVVMPIHRVQALKVTTGILRRRWGWHGLGVVSLSQDTKSGKHVVVPFAQMDEIAPVVGVTGFELPGPGVYWQRSSPKHKLDQALLGIIPFSLAAIATAVIDNRSDILDGWGGWVTGVFVAAAVFVALRENFLWRHDRSALDSRHIFALHGWVAPKLDIASRVKLQSVEISQGPIARRRGYATLTFGIAGGALAIAGVPLQEARTIRRAVLDSIAGVDFSRLGEIEG